MIARAIPALVFAAALLQSPAAAASERGDLILHRLLGLDQQALFGAEHSPLAEMEAWGEAYAALREEALADTSEDFRGIKLFMFAGWTARQRDDFATVGGFRTDMTALYQSRPDDVLAALADNAFMIPAVCGALGEAFAYEDGDPAARAPFVAANEARVRATLDEAGAASCLAALLGDGR